MDKNIKLIGLAKEVESPENPGALEKRVALVPEQVGEIVSKGITVFVEKGAGEGIGYSDEEYEELGAILQDHQDIYKNKDMVIKFKGPSLESIPWMNPGTILFCMAHFKSFPKRAELLEQKKINVIAMEEILESPKFIPDEIILSKKMVKETLLEVTIPLNELNIGFLGFGPQLIGGIRRAGNRNPDSLIIYQSNVEKEELEFKGRNAVYFYDSRILENATLIDYLKKESCQLVDLLEFEKKRGAKAIEEYRKKHLPFQTGGRRIQCLKETGMAGARYGFRLLKEESPKKIDGEKVVATVLGYGNVGMGAIEECSRQGVRKINILGRTTTLEGKIEPFLEVSDLIINGAEQPAELRGKNYLVKSKHTGNELKEGSVVIDLVGGSEVNRSAVEEVITCTFLTNPHFKNKGVYFSSLWGWPMMGMMKESAVRYSSQIEDVLMENEKLINGLDDLSVGLRQALVCGPFKAEP